MVVPFRRERQASVMGNGLDRRPAHDAPCPSVPSPVVSPGGRGQAETNGSAPTSFFY